MSSNHRAPWAFVAAALATATLTMASRPALALNAQCLTSPVSLPNLSGPPVWLDPSPATTTWRAELNDPRWAGAPLFNLCGNAELDNCALGSAQAQVRAFIDGTFLYVQFLNVVDDSQTTDDAVYIGIGERAAAGAKLARIDVDTGTPISPLPTVHDSTPPTANGAGTIHTASASNANGAAAWGASLTTGTVTWLQNVATWTNSLGGLPDHKWAISFRIDLAQLGYTTAPITAPIPLFLGSRHQPSTGSAVPLPNITTDTVAGSDTIVPGNKANWASFSPPAAGCTGGITLSSSNIGVVNGTSLVSEVGVCPTSGTMPAGCPHTTQFRAKPGNVPNGSAVYARMRLANFGSVYNDWPNAPWLDIPRAGNPLTDPEPTGGWGTKGWTFTAADASGIAQIDLTCDRATDTYCPILSNVPAQRDQCLLVELGAPPATNLKFENKAVYQNLWFKDLSTLDQNATISIKGLAQATGQAIDRDVYLYVQKANMPGHTNQAMELDQRVLRLLRNYADHRPAHPPYLGGKDQTGAKDRVKLEAAASKAPALDGLGKFLRAAAADETTGPSPLSVPTLSSDDALSLAWPTYKIHVYYDTGKKTHYSGTDHMVLAPMVPFGYYLNHQGTFFGFTDQLTGVNGAVLEPLGHDWYRVRIKNEGYVQVRTVITAEESPKGPAGKDCCCDKPPPPVKVEIHPRCYCTTPGMGRDGKSAWIVALMLGAALGRRLTRRRRS